MSNSKRRSKFTPEYREQAAERVLDPGLSAEQVAQTLNLSPSTLSNWIDQLKKERTGVYSGTPVSSLSAQNQALKKQVQRLQQDVDILKKASALLIADCRKNER